MLSKIYLFLFLKGSQGSEKHFAIFQVSFFIIFQKQPPEMFYKKAALKNFAIFTGGDGLQIY